MYLQVYVLIHLLCMGILTVILFEEKQHVDLRLEHIVFKRIIVYILLLLLLDISWKLIESYTTARILSIAINSIYMFITGVIGYTWMRFVNIRLGREHKISRTERIACAIPLAILFVVCLLTPWTGWLFTVDSHNVYHRGSLLFIQFVVSCAYLVYSSLIVIYCESKEQNKLNRSEGHTMVWFTIYPIIGVVIQLCFEGFPCIWPAATLSVLMIYIHFQNEQISTDALTELNNRRQLDYYLQMQITNIHKGQQLYLLLMDVNDFKNINDSYGHLQGDRALTLIAGALKAVCNQRNAFLARYGGDEFAAVLTSESAADVETLMKDIRQELAHCIATSQINYPISLSMGYAHSIGGDFDAIRQLIDAADSNMYEDKQQASLSVPQS